MNLSDLITFGRKEPGLPASLLRPNSAIPDLGPISEEQALENVNAYAGSKRFAANFIEPGLVLYKGKDGKPDEWVLVEADALERMAKSMVGKPVIDWDHADVWPEILGDGQADGVVYDVWKGEDGWWHAGFVVWTKSAVEHAESGDWSVSCAYDPTDEDATPGRHHNIDYTQKVLDGVYTHLALVKNPRYEKARIRANSNGGYKMAWDLFGKKKPEVLRLNAAEAAGKMLEVDGAPVGLNELVEKYNAAAASAAPTNVLTAADDDAVEHEGKSYRVGDLRNAHRNSMKARQNAEEKEKAEKEAKEKKERENAARKNDEQLAGAGKGQAGKLAGAAHDKVTGVEDNPDAALEAGKEISALKERLNSLTNEIKELRSAPARELREAAHARMGPVGGVIEDQGFVQVEDRIRAGNKDFALDVE